MTHHATTGIKGSDVQPGHILYGTNLVFGSKPVTILTVEPKMMWVKVTAEDHKGKVQKGSLSKGGEYAVVTSEVSDAAAHEMRQSIYTEFGELFDAKQAERWQVYAQLGGGEYAPQLDDAAVKALTAEIRKIEKDAARGKPLDADAVWNRLEVAVENGLTTEGSKIDRQTHQELQRMAAAEKKANKGGWFIGGGVIF